MSKVTLNSSMVETSHLNLTTSTIDRYIGKQLQLHRVEKGLSAQSLAKSLSISIENYELTESGLHRLAASDLFIMKRLFDLPLSHFFTHDGQYFSDIVIDGSEVADVVHYFSNVEDTKVRASLLKRIKLASSVF